MKKILATALSLAALSSVYGQGTATLANNIGATIFTIKNEVGAIAGGAKYSVEVFKYDAAASGGFGALLGAAVSPSATGRFNAGTGFAIPGAAPGTSTSLIVRAWDNSTGASYAASTIKGASPSFLTGTLGGDPDGDGPLLPITPVGMIVAGSAFGSGFSLTSATLIPEPTTIALGALGVAALFIRRRK